MREGEWMSKIDSPGVKSSTRGPYIPCTFRGSGRSVGAKTLSQKGIPQRAPPRLVLIFKANHIIEHIKAIDRQGLAPPAAPLARPAAPPPRRRAAAPMPPAGTTAGPLALPPRTLLGGFIPDQASAGPPPLRNPTSASVSPWPGAPRPRQAAPMFQPSSQEAPPSSPRHTVLPASAADAAGAQPVVALAEPGLVDVMLCVSSTRQCRAMPGRRSWHSRAH